MPKDLAIVLNNGSINSAVVTAIAAQKYRPVMIFADVVPGAGGRMRAAYDQQVGHFKPYREYSVPIALAGTGPVNNPASASDPRQGANISPQLLDLLPLVSLAMKSAAHHQAAAIYFGLRVGPSTDELAQATEYCQIWNEMVQMPCAQGEMELLAPLLELEPWQVVDVGFQVGAAVGADVELPGGNGGALLGLPGVPREGGGVSAGGEAGSDEGGEEELGIIDRSF